VTLFARDIELKLVAPPCNGHQTAQLFFTRILSGILALACLVAADLASAATTFDGHWSVVIITDHGECDPTFRYGLQIANGTISADAAATVQGRVSAAGTVRVIVQSGDQRAAGSGRLSADRGSGVWRGKGTRGSCSGTWLAERRF
jgi:hypothetical protein